MGTGNGSRFVNTPAIFLTGLANENGKDQITKN